MGRPIKRGGAAKRRTGKPVGRPRPAWRDLYGGTSPFPPPHHRRHSLLGPYFVWAVVLHGTPSLGGGKRTFPLKRKKARVCIGWGLLWFGPLKFSMGLGLGLAEGLKRGLPRRSANGKLGRVGFERFVAPPRWQALALFRI